MIFTWDWKDPVPYIEMLKYKHIYPTAHLYEFDDHGGTFTYLIFAPTKKIALREVEKSFGNDISISSSEIQRIF